MNDKATTASSTADREISAVRIFDAPRDLVFDVWTDPKHVSQWWGPRGFTTTTYQMDVRPGGTWRFVMHGPDGTDYDNRVTFIEVVRPQRIVYKHSGENEHEAVNFMVTVTFEEVAGESGKTKLSMRMLFPTAEERNLTAEKYGSVEGLHQTLDRFREKVGDVAAGKADPDAPAGDRELVVSRVIDAPRSRVFKAWTEPEQVAQWWGPRGMSTPVCEIDLKPGGAFRTVMRDAGGVEYPCLGAYRGIVENERLVFTNAGLDDSGSPQFEILATITFEDHAGDPKKTKLTARVHHKTVADRVKHEEMGFYQSWGETWDRLAEHVLTHGDDAFVITREFDAPRDLVFKMWTDPQHMGRWWGPKDYDIASCTIDLRPGGACRYHLRSPEGQDVWGKLAYRDIVPPQRLTFLVMFTDEEGHAVRHPMSPTWPLHILSTVTFATRGAKTLITVRWIPFEATAEERQTFEAGRDSMRMGWTGTFDRLAGYLPRV